MHEQRIVPANSSRLLSDMLKRIIDKSSNLELLKAITDPRDLPAVIENSDPAWVIVSLSCDNVIPAWVDEYMAQHPSVRCMAVSSDASKIKMKWLETHEQELNGLSLQSAAHL